MTPTQPEPESPRFSRLRALLFIPLALVFGAVLIALMTWWVIGSAPRSQAVAVAEGIRVAEFAALPDDDAYPAALAIDAAGGLYTGSYQSGALWSISPEGEVREIAGSRERIGSVSGLDLAPDGALYVLDRIDPVAAKGASIWRFKDGELRLLFTIPKDEGASDGIMLPDDIAVDSDGRIYISDRAGRIFRVSAEGERLDGGVGGAWRNSCNGPCAPTGLAYDRANDDILFTDGALDSAHRIGGLDLQSSSYERIYSAEDDPDYGFDGITVSPDGDIYIALLNWNRVARLDAGELVMLAKDFRGASDVAYDPARDRLYATNWNQFGLAFGTSPQLPFAIDVIHLSPTRD